MDNLVYSCEALAALPIHSSAVETGNGVLLFLGPSETGKSTVRSLLEAYMPSLADDLVCLIPQGDGSWKVASVGLWAFAKPLTAAEVATLRSRPLRSVLRLHRAAEPRLERLPELETCRCLVDAFFEVHWPRHCPVETRRWAFHALADVARTVPGYRFHFDRSERTVQVVLETFRETTAQAHANRRAHHGV